jgi:hypothetical protein
MEGYMEGLKKGRVRDPSKILPSSLPSFPAFLPAFLPSFLPSSHLDGVNFNAEQLVSKVRVKSECVRVVALFPWKEGQKDGRTDERTDGRKQLKTLKKAAEETEGRN